MAKSRKKAGPFRERWNWMWLEIWNIITEHGSLVVFGGIVFAMDWARQQIQTDDPIYRLLWIAEWTTGLTMIGPKFLRSAGVLVQTGGNLLQNLVIQVHHLAYAVRHGKRKPLEPDEADETAEEA